MTAIDRVLQDVYGKTFEEAVAMHLPKIDRSPKPTRFVVEADFCQHKRVTYDVSFTRETGEWAAYIKQDNTPMGHFDSYGAPLRHGESIECGLCGHQNSVRLIETEERE